MDDIIKQLIGNAPWAILLFFMLRQVYEDARADRLQAAQERQAMLSKLDALEIKLESLDKSIMMLQMSIENWNTLRRRRGKTEIEQRSTKF